MDTVLIIGVCGAIYYILYKVFKSLSQPKRYSLDSDFREVNNSFQNEMNQNLEDKKVERYIREEAYNKYKQYISNKDRGLGTLVYIGSPLCTYTIYDEKTAKYKNGNINKIIDEEYNKLIKKYEL